MNCSYPYLYRFFKLLFLTIFFLTIIQMFLPVSDAALIGFCLYGSGIILAGELFRKTEHKREMLITAAVLLVILFLFGYLNREWIAEIYQSYRQELIILLLLPVFVLGIFLLEEKLIYSSVLFLFFLIFSALREIPLSKAGAAAALSFVFLSLIEGSVFHLYGKNYREKLSGFFLLPLLLSFCLAVFPVHAEPYPFTALKHVWNQLRESTYVLYTEISLFVQRQSSDFFVQFTGYNEKGGIGGSLLQSDRPALTVSVPGSLHGNLYLTGNIQNHYENNVWTFVSPAEASYERSLEDELVLDYLEFQYALYEAGYLEDARAYIWHTKASLTYQGLYTKDMFFPLKLYDFRQFEEYSSREKKFTAHHPLKEGDSYSFRYMALNYGSAALEELIRSREETVYRTGLTDNTDFAAVIRRSYPPLQDYVPLESFEAVLAERKASIYRNYMQIPDYLYTDIKTLTDELTQDAASDYEKLKMIENYLQGFVYTLTPAETEGDAVASFLFDTHEGYCTYFASAFVLMSRAAGIPARYVNGFCVPLYSENRREFIVGSDCAHAWPEAYLNGIGWISFEPTAGFSQYHDTPWQYVPADETAAASDETLQEPEIEDISAQTLPEKPELSAQLSDEPAVFAGRFLSVCLLLVPIVIIIFCFIRLYYRRKKYRHSKKKDKLAFLIYYELLLLKGLGMCRKREETLLQFADKILVRYPQLSQAGLTEFIHVYMDSFYGEIEPEDTAVNAAEQCVLRTEQLYQGIRRLKILMCRLRSENQGL